jgi:hypothetical protein
MPVAARGRVTELWRPRKRISIRPTETEIQRDILLRHDVSMCYGVLGMRQVEDKTDVRGHESWWATGDGTAFQMRRMLAAVGMVQHINHVVVGATQQDQIRLAAAITDRHQGISPRSIVAVGHNARDLADHPLRVVSCSFLHELAAAAWEYAAGASLTPQDLDVASQVVARDDSLAKATAVRG